MAGSVANGGTTADIASVDLRSGLSYNSLIRVLWVSHIDHSLKRHEMDSPIQLPLKYS